MALFNLSEWYAWFRMLLNMPINKRVLFLGLDNAGKTTLLGRLRDERIAAHAPTQHPNSQTILIGSIACNIFDLGGHQQARRLWRDYCHGGDVAGVVYVLDMADPDRWPEAIAELRALLAIEELPAGVPFAILANKVDLLLAGHYSSSPSAALITPQALDTMLGSCGLPVGLDRHVYANEGQRRVRIFETSVVEGVGYGEALMWLLKQMTTTL